MLAFAAVCDFWHAPHGANLAQVVTVTCPPSADVSDIHDSMGVILSTGDFATWPDGSQQKVAKLMQPLQAGALFVETAKEADWSAP